MDLVIWMGWDLGMVTQRCWHLGLQEICTGWHMCWGLVINFVIWMGWDLGMGCSGCRRWVLAMEWEERSIWH